MLKIAPSGQMYVSAPTSPSYGKRSRTKKEQEIPKQIPSDNSPSVVPKIGKYIDPKIDWAAKHLFGKGNEDFLKSLLDTLFDGQKQLGSFTYLDKEHTGNTKDDRTSIFDLMVFDSNEQHFLFECQIARHKYFMKRVIFYMAKFLNTQGKKGDWDHNFLPITGVCITGFENPDGKDDPADTRYIKEFGLSDKETDDPVLQDCSIIIVDLQKFNKKEEELHTMQDKWLYLLKNLPKMKKKPAIYNEPIFNNFFRNAEFMKLTNEDKEKYTVANKKRWDHYSEIETAKDDGRAEGRTEGRTEGRAEGRAEKKAELQIEFVKSLLHKTDFSFQKIAEIAKVSNAMVKKISNEEIFI